MKQINVLIIDDCEVDRYILKRHLNKIGVMNVFEKDDGLSALQFLKDYEENRKIYKDKFPPIVIFLDINMPNIGGFEFLEKFAELRKTLELKSCVIMMYSSSDLPEDKARASSFNFVKDFLTKGEIQIDELKTKIEAL
ncbi:response regulator [uncultured Psychrosphaera sp.]|uniref:response regulator n=1 Tax=uncultured Psychrosphaera sp. TaxID=1403522 RepID=UPI0026318599|nr:response regulator [uncultured Psychrosphaera sp.]